MKDGTAYGTMISSSPRVPKIHEKRMGIIVGSIGIQDMHYNEYMT